MATARSWRLAGLTRTSRMPSLVARDGSIAWLKPVQTMTGRSGRSDSTWRARDFLAYLRAMTFPGIRNAYYVDAETGRRCYLSLLIERDEPG